MDYFFCTLAPLKEVNLKNIVFMIRYNSPHRQTRLGMLYKIGITLMAISLIVYFYPRERTDSYQFELGQPWKYGQLIAEFDFPIYKDEAAVKKEQDSVMRNYMPYFRKEKSISEQRLNGLETFLASAGTGRSGTLKIVYDQLKKVYEQGIIGHEHLAKLKSDTIDNIMIVEDNSAVAYRVENFYSEKEAYEKLLTSDTTRYGKQIMQQCDLHQYIAPNVMYDREKSESAREELLNSVSWSSGMVVDGTKIIDRGEIIERRTYDILHSLLREMDERRETNTQKQLILGGQILFVGILIACFFFYLDLFRQDYYDRNRTILLLMAMIVGFPVLASLMVTHSFFNVYIIPFTMVPIIVRIFMDSRTAFIVHFIILLLCSIVLRYPYEFILIQSVGGLVGIYSLRELSQRSQLLRAALLVTLVEMLFYFAYEMVHTNDLAKLDTGMYISLAVNGLLLLFTYPLLFMLEKAFGFTSNVTLVELSNINTSLLRRMSEVAPGTFQHSLQVSNIAAEAARKIGANSQLVRTGALYHDIGKIENPVFFTENQSGINPHNNLSYMESAQIIINHVTDGLRLADKYNLPKVIRNFIATHHGKGMTKYFYISYRNEHPDEEIDKALFTYLGPNPSTREEAILMMTDAVEAASRSLKEYTEESIGELVDHIVDAQVADGAFRECDITFKDVETIKSVFKEKLKTVYHTRISYPELKK